MIILNDFLIDLKRTNQYGDASVTDDAVTLDLIRWINNYKRRTANKTAWSWLLQTFDVTVVAGAQEITLDSSIRKIVAIGNDDGAYLQKVTVKEALTWNADTSSVSVLGYYMDNGVTTTGAKKIKVFGNPGTSATLPGYGLTKFADIVVGDLTSGTATFTPFPDEIMNIISDLVAARIQKAKGNPLWKQYEDAAWADMAVTMGDEQSDPADDVTTPLPPYYRRRRILRRGGQVA